MSQAYAVTHGETPTVVAEIPPARVHRALHTKECEYWWGVEGANVTRNSEADLRVGGAGASIPCSRKDPTTPRANLCWSTLRTASS